MAIFKFLYVYFYLRPLIMKNLADREIGLLPDEWSWADLKAIDLGYFVSHRGQIKKCSGRGSASTMVIADRHSPIIEVGDIFYIDGKKCRCVSSSHYSPALSEKDMKELWES